MHIVTKDNKHGQENTTAKKGGISSSDGMICFLSVLGPVTPVTLVPETGTLEVSVLCESNAGLAVPCGDKIGLFRFIISRLARRISCFLRCSSRVGIGSTGVLTHDSTKETMPKTAWIAVKG